MSENAPALQAAPAVLEICSISKAFNGTAAVRNLSFSVHRGAIYGLLGPNGAGKTTTIRMILDIIMPDSGSVRLFGSAFHRDCLRRIGYLPEERGLYKKMKVGDMLVFLALLHGLGQSEARRRVDEWMRRLEMSDWAAKKVEDLSRGMQQKVQFAGTLLHEPDLVVLDEPFAGLDPVNVVMLKDVMLELKHAGKTIIFSTHQMEQVERLCEAICLVNKGRSVLQGNLREIRRSFGRNVIVTELEGDWRFVQGVPGVREAVDKGNQVEIKLLPGADAQAVLAALVGRVRVSRFEVTEPSLEEIFILSVKGAEKAAAAAAG
jgi:ABC-2 type transport system ATP-binding protein